MKKKTFAILFYVKRTKLLRNGEAPIFMRITVDAVRAEMSIQRSIMDGERFMKNRIIIKT